MSKEAVRELKGYRIRPYGHGWELQAHYVYFDEKRAGQETWDAENWYGSFSAAVSSFVDKKLGSIIEGQNPIDLLAAIEQAKKEAIAVANELKVSYQEAHKVMNHE